MMKTKDFSNLGVQAHTDVYEGIPLLHFQKKGEPFTLNCAFDFGSFWERDVSAAHFLEHLLLWGGNTYANKKMLTDAFEERGCSFNATTNNFNLWVKELNNSSSDLQFAATTLADILLHAKIAPESIESERKVIVAEREKTDKEKSRVLINLFCATLFPDTRLAIDNKGDRDTILKITREDLMSAYDSLLESRKVIVTSGDFSFAEVKEKLGGLLAQLGKSDSTNREVTHLPIRKGAFKVSNTLKTSGVAIFFDRTAYGDPKKTAVHAFLNNLLFGKNGLLLQKLRYDTPLVYGIADYSRSGYVIDFLGAFAETAPENIELAREILTRTIIENLPERITKAEVNKFIESTRARERRRYNTGDLLVDRYSIDYLNLGDSMVWHDDLLLLLEKIPIDEIAAEARQVFNKVNQTVIITS